MERQLGQQPTTSCLARANSPAPLVVAMGDGAIDIDKLKKHVYDVIGAIHSVHDELGAGVNEYCYQEALEWELADRGIPFNREMSFHPLYKGHPLKAEYRVDFLCKGDIVIECKAVDVLNATMRAQLFNYMRLLKAACGIIVNFAPKFAEIERYFFDAARGVILTVTGEIIK